MQIFLVALRLGCTSFGGPVAHLAYFREAYVARRRWLDEEKYADLVALCQFLPGPASSQVGFGVGYLKRGIAGGLAAWTGFTLPSALLMIGFAQGLRVLGASAGSNWLNGLKAAAVAVVAHAVWSMGRTLCPDRPRQVLALLAATGLLWLPFAWSQFATIVLGSVLGWIFLKGSASLSPPAPSAPATCEPRAPLSGATLCLGAFVVLLAGLPWLAHDHASATLAMFDRFYRAGSLVFGGGHVVLPLLEREVVAPGWITHDAFLAGYGAAQALPGPLFTFAAYLGAVSNHGWGGVPGGLWALLAVFLPALLLVAGAMPFWTALRRRPAAQAALRGANATVVGILLAALVHPVGTSGIRGPATLALALGGFAALQFGKIPAWAVVASAAALGAVLT